MHHLVDFIAFFMVLTVVCSLLYFLNLNLLSLSCFYKFWFIFIWYRLSPLTSWLLHWTYPTGILRLNIWYWFFFADIFETTLGRGLCYVCWLLAVHLYTSDEKELLLCQEQWEFQLILGFNFKFIRLGLSCHLLYLLSFYPNVPQKLYILTVYNLLVLILTSVSCLMSIISNQMGMQID